MLNSTVDIQALVDTGASLSCISLTCTLKHKIMYQPTNPENIVLKSACKNILHIVGTVDISIIIAGLEFPLTAYVVEGLSVDLILGIPFLEITKAQIDCHRGQITFYDDLISAELQNAEPLFFLKTMHPITVPPGSEMIFPVQIPRNCTWDSFLIEPLDTTYERGLAVASSVVAPTARETICRVLNPTPFEVNLPINCPVAKCSRFTEIFALTTAINATPASCTEPDRPSEPDMLQAIKDKGIAQDFATVDPSHRSELIKLLYDNRDLFATSLKDLPGCNYASFSIDTGSAPPVRSRFYRHSPKARDVIQKEIQDMLEADIIEPSSSMWASPTIAVAKPHQPGQWRVCIDYRKVNSLTASIAYPLLPADQIFSMMAEKRPALFSTCDLKSGFMQFFISDEESRDRTTFVVESGTYRFKRCPFGLKNIPLFFARCMNEILSATFNKYLSAEQAAKPPPLWNCCLCYIDDIIIFSPDDIVLHAKYIQAVFDRLRAANLRLNGKKCIFAQRQAAFLGSVVDSVGIHPDPAKVKLILDWPTPKDTHQLRSFTGLVNFYRKFIRGFSHIASAFRNLLVKDAPFVWETKHQEAFDSLKQALASSTVLHHPDLSKPFILTTDASGSAIGFILSQKDDNGTELPIYFAGRSLTLIEQRYSVTHREALAIVQGVQYFHHYLICQKFTIISDHVCLSFLQSMRNKSGRLGRWSVFLSQYDFELKHKAGITLTNADALSRRECTLSETIPYDDSLDHDENFIFRISPDVVDGSHLSEITLIYDHESTTVDEDFLTPQVVMTLEAFTTDSYDIVQLQSECKDCKPIVNYLSDNILPTDAHWHEK